MKPMKRDKRLADNLRDRVQPNGLLDIDLTLSPTITVLALHLGLIELDADDENYSDKFYYRLTPIGEIYINDSIPLARNEAQDTPASEPVADDSIPQGDRLNREYTHPEFVREFFPNIDPDEIDQVTKGTSSNTLTYAQLESALSNQGIKYRKLGDENQYLRQQLAERNEDYRVLQADMRRMADENRRLRAFVQKIAEPPEPEFADPGYVGDGFTDEYEWDYMPGGRHYDPERDIDYSLHYDSIDSEQPPAITPEEARALLDTEAAPDVAQPTEHAEIRLWDNSEQRGDPLFVGTMKEVRDKAQELTRAGQTVFLDDPAWPYLEKHYPFRAATDMPAPDATGSDNL